MNRISNHQLKITPHSAKQSVHSFIMKTKLNCINLLSSINLLTLNFMVKPLFSIFILGFICACSSEKKTDVITEITVASTETIVPQSPSTYKFAAYLCDSSNYLLGFGYNIILDDHVFIHQPSIPSIQGNKGFATKVQAEKVAQLVIYKLTHNIMPPSVTTKELDSLGILK